MKREAKISLSIAAVCLILLCPGFARAGSVQNAAVTKNTATKNASVSKSAAAKSMAAKSADSMAMGVSAMPMAREEASRMVSAQASLLSALDGRKIKPGALFRARLSHTVYLKNGPELSGGTVLWGKVTTDKMGVDGRSRLVLRFTRAELGNGKTIPIHATIMGISAPQSGYYEDSSYQMPLAWNGKTLQMDEIGAVSGHVDLHSKIASWNSGVFVAKKDDVKLARGSQLTLAIAERGMKNHGSSMSRGA